jgi:uncharacterized membrane protein
LLKAINLLWVLLLLLAAVVALALSAVLMHNALTVVLARAVAGALVHGLMPLLVLLDRVLLILMEEQERRM